jgi:hypothetical protein
MFKNKSKCLLKLAALQELASGVAECKHLVVVFSEFGSAQFFSLSVYTVLPETLIQ